MAAHLTNSKNAITVSCEHGTHIHSAGAADPSLEAAIRRHARMFKCSCAYDWIKGYREFQKAKVADAP